MMNDTLRAACLLIVDEAGKQGKGWDYQGVHSTVRRAVEDDGRQLADVVVAGVSAARSTAAQTPGAIRWGNLYSHTPPSAPYSPACGVCGRPRHAHDAAEALVAPALRHDFTNDTEGIR